jgi:hypothetical protein
MKSANATKFNRKSGEAEGSAVHSAFATKVHGKTNLSSRPKRSGVEGSAVLLAVLAAAIARSRVQRRHFQGILKKYADA